MKKHKLLASFAVSLLLASPVSTALAASYGLFGATPIVGSGQLMTSDQAISFATVSRVLTCTTPHTVIISSTPDGSGGVFVDNFLTVNGKNVCPGGNCFSGPGTIPVSPLNISSLIPSGKHLVTFELMDWGVVLGNSPLYLVTTNCSVLSREIICHNPGSSVQRQLPVTQSVISRHLGEGDSLGRCP